MLKRATVIVLDSVGVGELPDADRYGDRGSNTLAHIAVTVGGLHLPYLEQLGLGRIIPIAGVAPVPWPQAAYGKMAEKSAGKDTTTGHWEIAGIILERPFPVYPEGFPPEVIDEFTRRIGRPVLGNKPASGTAIIEELGPEHLRTGFPIVYTSADSVFQIAASEDIIPVEELYRYCRIAREILTGEHAVARVIARPFVGRSAAFQRTARRRDFSLPPPEPTILDKIKETGREVYGIGKIEDIFAGRGLTRASHTPGNLEGIEKTCAALEEDFSGLVLTNLVDYDMLYGHRNDPVGYARALEEFDRWLPEILRRVGGDEVLIITADHGCDPTTPSTDHSREYVPLLVYRGLGSDCRGRGEPSPRLSGADLGIRETFADIAVTLARWFSIKWSGPGTPLPGL